MNTFLQTKANGQKRRLLIILISALILALLGIWYVYHDKTTPTRFVVEDFAKRDLQYAVDTIAQATVDGGAPGAVILVRHKGQEYIASAGVANKKTKTMMPKETPLRIGSVSKVYTATVILKLANDNKLDLDKPISAYLSADILAGLPNGQTATVRHLLKHTSGIPDYYDLRSYLTSDWTQAITLERTLPAAKRGSSNFASGQKFEYSNMGYVLLGKIAENVSGKNFAALIESEITQPLGLNNTYYNIKYPKQNEIHGYGTFFRPWADTYDWWEHSGPDGGITATASETARFLEALTFTQGEFYSIGRQMLEALIPSQRNLSQGLGLETINGKSGVTLIGHTGDVFGYQTAAFARPELDVVFVTHINCDCTALTSSVLRNTHQAIKALLDK